ncbi:hypothetical protein E3P77_00125 [Wallemia ichthyophaga]|uniref:Uncharacterized protein n=2 Tax=Wallemia ichthyophaga TaxID=245174 RepID=A0A4T0GUD5_WALIC|nr:uncharacterized protein J056_002267 [Wallemia ichthyophaga EXF-994]TIA76163.1 hypothetical protein E3P91_00124 [Wallemia ichthyophaga]EOR04189.1 hypothetical protein J056_002267 [Wallemia ichthyophaga EXF-994]TIA80479.1 hypothetical protein E3P98_02663 [Wallemia ichthyophaga]TIA94461.1 hypothetical protein E3P97_00125 [Wallemia ichthyophaga]TIB04766.1 hypothetical protein E3P95_00124 [Wallemia ichthyophaga]
MVAGISELNPSAVGDVSHWDIPSNACTIGVDEAISRKMDSFDNLKQKDIHFNDRLQASQQFHNPHINHRLISWAGVDEYSTNTPDGALYSEYSTHTSSAAALESLQRQRTHDKAASASKRANVDFAPATSATPATSKSRRQ